MVNNDDDDDDDYPLNCIDDTGDGFSGWFAISNPRQCNDFCYWHLPSSSSSNNSNDDDDNNNNNNNNNSDSNSHIYAPSNTADPHQSTAIHTPSGTAYWTCIYDSADDNTKVSAAKEERWIDSWEKYSSDDAMQTMQTLQVDDNDVDIVGNTNNVPFPYLKCQKGAGEKLKTWSGAVVRSAIFWESWIVLASLIFVGEFLALFFFYRRGKLRYEQVGSESFHEEGSGGDVADDDQDQEGRDVASFHIDQVEGDNRGTNNDDDISNGNENSHTQADEDDESSSYETRFSFIQQRRTIRFNRVVTPRCKYCTPITSSSLCNNNNPKNLKLRRLFCILRILLVITLNLLLAFTISFSAISLMEINSSPHFTEGMEKLTPACSDPTLVCAAGNDDIDGQSARWPPPPKTTNGDGDAHGRKGDEATIKNPDNDDDGMQPFSYIIASDAQLYWFNGEFAEMGREPIPPSCSPSDSCGRCTGKQGLKTNRNLKNAWEHMMTGKTDGLSSNATTGDLPVPKTLIMNGDLTAYFHPYEKLAYDSIYNNIEGLKYYWPSLGNHDIEHPGGAMFGGDEWVGVPNCNMEHAIGYFKSGFCGRIPAFQTDRIVRYDSSSLAYSWEEGRYHFVHCHYYPTYEMASVNYRSSLQWLERDLQMARDAGLTTVLFVHAVQGLNPAMENIILGKNVKAIIAGHTHRCLHRRCEGVYPLHEEQVENLDSLGIDAEKCIPAAWDTCEVLNGENVIFAKDMEADVPFPKNELHNREHKPDKPLCPQPSPFYINETDNSLLCRRVKYSEPNYPFEREDNSTETIPIFWSGSSSFETFLRGDFFEDKIVINAMTVATEEGEVARYVDLHEVPNAIYPHAVSDLEEVVIYLEQQD